MGTVPFSNPAGNNQTNPTSSMLPKPIAAPAIPGAPSTVSSGQQNPYMPVNAGAIPKTEGSTGAGPSVPNAGGLINSPANTSGTTGALQKQLDDIYGKGVGGALTQLLEGMSGTDSTILQQYIASLQPQMAKAQANTNAALGAGGVSANSSVAAIADSNLQSQETAAIAGEEAKLTQSQEELTAQILTGMQSDSSKQVASSGWDVLSQVTSAIGDVASIIPKV